MPFANIPTRALQVTPDFNHKPVVFFIGQAYQVKVQVDDIHKLYANGQLVSSGSDYHKEYSVSISWAPVLALYAENFVSMKELGLSVCNS